jgi:hypothetical protein
MKAEIDKKLESSNIILSKSQKSLMAGTDWVAIATAWQYA